MVMVPQVQIPDFAGSILRGEQVGLSRLQALAQRQALADSENARQVAAQVLPGLGTLQGPELIGGLGRLVAADPRYAAFAAPLIQRERDNAELGIGGAPAPAPAAPAAGGGMGGIRTGAAIPVPDTLDDADILARTILGEAANQGEIGQRAVAAVIRNRMQQTGRGVRDVVLAPSQFEPWATRRDELLRIPTNDPRYVAARRLAEETLAGRIEDPTRGATHFLNPDLQRNLGRAQPAWAPEGQGQRIGAHVFYTPGGGVRVGQGAPPSGATIPAQNAGGDTIPAQNGEMPRHSSGLPMPPGYDDARMARVAAASRASPNNATAQAILQQYRQDVQVGLALRRSDAPPAPPPTVTLGEGPHGPAGVYERTPQGLRYIGPQAERTPMTIGTIPPGFQLERTPEGAFRMVPIPGGPADLAERRTQRAENARQEGTQRTGNVVLQDLDRTLTLLDTANLPVAGIMAGTLARVPGTAAADASRLLDSVRANVGFAQLAQMRAESPTGAALGAVTERELQFLQSVLGSLDQQQSPQQFRDNLVRLRNVFLDIVHGPGQGPARVQPSFQRGAAQPAGSRAPDATPAPSETPGPGGQGVAESPTVTTRRRYNPATGRIE